MTSWAVPGAKCVCVDADPKGGCWEGIAPFEGQTYVFVEHRGTPFSEACGTFATLDGQTVHGGGKVWICRFRPLVARKSEAEDLALFTHHLEMGEPVVVGGVSYRSLGRA